jgi:hypothetical protein
MTIQFNTIVPKTFLTIWIIFLFIIYFFLWTLSASSLLLSFTLFFGFSGFIYKNLHMSKHSKRYREVFQKIEPNKQYSLVEALSFLQENNQEKSKNIEMAVSLHWGEKKMPLRSQLTLPHPIKRQEKIVIIGEELPPALQNEEGIELVSLEKIPQLVEKEKKIKVFAHTS